MGALQTAVAYNWQVVVFGMSVLLLAVIGLSSSSIMMICGLGLKFLGW